MVKLRSARCCGHTKCLVQREEGRTVRTKWSSIVPKVAGNAPVWYNWKEDRPRRYGPPTFRAVLRAHLSCTTGKMSSNAAVAHQRSAPCCVHSCFVQMDREPTRTLLNLEQRCCSETRALNSGVDVTRCCEHICQVQQERGNSEDDNVQHRSIRYLS